MARDSKGLKGFGEVAKSNVVNSNANANINPVVNVNDPLDKLQAENPAKELTTVMKGVYFDSEVWNVIAEQSKKLGRGGKSKLVNEIVKNYFIQKGLL